MIASIKLELWYLKTPEMNKLAEREGALVAKGALLTLFECLRLSHNAVGHRSMLKNIALVNHCDADWLWRVVTESGLFEYNADETFTSPYLSDTLGLGHNSRSSRARTRYKARYNDDNNDNNHNENKEKTPPACVCRNDTQHEALDSPQPPQYLGYDRVVDGCRYGYRGEPIPDDAPEQTSQDTRWSWRRGRWIPRAQWHEKQEKKQYELTTKQKWQTISGQ